MSLPCEDHARYHAGFKLVIFLTAHSWLAPKSDSVREPCLFSTRPGHRALWLNLVRGTYVRESHYCLCEGAIHFGVVSSDFGGFVYHGERGNMHPGR